MYFPGDVVRGGILSMGGSYIFQIKITYLQMTETESLPICVFSKKDDLLQIYLIII